MYTLFSNTILSVLGNLPPPPLPLHSLSLNIILKITTKCVTVTAYVRIFSIARDIMQLSPRLCPTRAEQSPDESPPPFLSAVGSAPTSPSASNAVVMMRSWGAAAAAGSFAAGDIAITGEVLPRAADAAELALDDAARGRNGGGATDTGGGVGRGAGAGMGVPPRRSSSTGALSSFKGQVVRNEDAQALLHEVCQEWCTWSWPRLFLKVTTRRGLGASPPHPPPSSRKQTNKQNVTRAPARNYWNFQTFISRRQ